MEDIIINKLCDFCNNKKENCMGYEEGIQKDIFVYRCINYARKETREKEQNDENNY